jgi:2-oxoglutarate ferredoxin oxidoreductase subunit gamma
MRYEIKCVGFGGQGIALMARILGLAASIYSDPPIKSVFTQSYGPESRGGASGANIVIESDPDMEIEYPYVISGNINYMVIMSQEGYEKYVDQIKNGGIIFLDPDLVDEDSRIDKASVVYRIPATKIAEQKTGRRIVANIVMLGFVSNYLPIIPQENIFEAMLSRVPTKFRDLNREAFELGQHFTRELVH